MRTGEEKCLVEGTPDGVRSLAGDLAHGLQTLLQALLGEATACATLVRLIR